MVTRCVNEGATVHRPIAHPHAMVTRRVNEGATVHAPSLIRTANNQELLR